jgi:hypothetical protein
MSNLVLTQLLNMLLSMRLMCLTWSTIVFSCTS